MTITAHNIKSLTFSQTWPFFGLAIPLLKSGRGRSYKQLGRCMQYKSFDTLVPRKKDG